MLLWTKSLFSLQIVQVLYGTYMAAEVAYYTYCYAKMDRDKYQVVSGHVKAALLSGRFIASVLGQLLYNFQVMDLRELNYITLAAQATSFIFAVLLPSVGTSLYFFSTTPQEPIQHSSSNDDISKISMDMNSIEHLANTQKPRFSGRKAMNLMYKHFNQSYSNVQSVTLPSIWWALGMCGFLQVQSYVQFLWIEINNNEENLYNGAVEAVLTLFGALSALLAGNINMAYFERFNFWILAFCAALEGVFIIISALTQQILVAYLMYIAFGVLYSFMITLL